jgi:methionyl-tRNA formyltransferase
MNQKSKTVVFFGNEQLATGVVSSTPTIQALHAAGYTISAIISNQKKIASRSQKISTIAETASKLGIDLLTPEKIGDVTQTIQNFKADIGVLVAYGQIIPQSIIDAFPYGIINIHPSLLPKHRGSTPIESVILNGETETGVSIMQLVRGMDAGPIYKQQKITITGRESKQELCDTLLHLGSKLIMDVLPQILNGEIEPIPQDSSEVTTDNQIRKEDGTINWDEPSIDICRKIRAFNGWPGSRTTLGDVEVVITEAHSEDIEGVPGELNYDKQKLSVAAKAGGLVIDRLKPIGKNEMTIAAFLSGYRSRL